MRLATTSSGLLNRLYDWLAVSDAAERSDVIFVLAGRECRKPYGLSLQREGWAPTLLLSVGRFELRKFSRLDLPSSSSPDLVAIASSTPPERRHYFVKIDSGRAQAMRIAPGRFGTLSEITALSDWLRGHTAARSVMVLSSGFHLRRVRMCCRRLLPKGTRLSFVAVPEESEGWLGRWWQDPGARKLVVSEVLKIVMYKLLFQRPARKGRSSPGLPEESRTVAAV